MCLKENSPMQCLNRNRIFWRSIPTLMLLFAAQCAYSQEKCIQAGKDQQSGTENGYYWELWNQNSKGTACMTLGTSGSFSGRWSGIENYLARRGRKYNETQTHQQIGAFNVKFNCDYKPSASAGNSYLSIYGWTVDPLVEYYIIEDWRNWIPSKDGSAQNKGTFTIDGSAYDIVQTTRVDKPSIKNNTTFPQFFSIRKNTRTSGTMQVSEHFKKWESLGMKMGKMYEVSFVVEGYQSSGSFDFKELEVNVGNSSVDIPVTIAHKVKVVQTPNSRDLSIHLAPSLESPVVRVYNTEGRLVGSGENQHSIQLPRMEAGIHFVKVQSASQSYSTKVTVY
ncbi:MAG: glycoside hydrolase family 11 protein [Fibrobacteres bacterium]|nr:glycoside hydrolase family 11 protein [Fibrobacterota bacterium]